MAEPSFSIIPIVILGVLATLFLTWVGLLVLCASKKAWGAFVGLLIVVPILGCGGLSGLSFLMFRMTVRQDFEVKSEAMRQAMSDELEAMGERRVLDEVESVARAVGLQVTGTSQRGLELEITALGRPAAFRKWLDGVESMDTIEVVSFDLPGEDTASPEAADQAGSLTVRSTSAMRRD